MCGPAAPLGAVTLDATPGAPSRMGLVDDPKDEWAPQPWHSRELDPSMVEGARWSNAVRCPRMAALHLDGEIPAPTDPDMEGYQERGHLWEIWALAELKALYPDSVIVEQLHVPWAHGIIHADFYVESERLFVEHKSRTVVEAHDADILQVAGAVHFHPEAERGEVWVTHPVNPRNRLRLPVILTDELRERIIAIEKLISRRHVQQPPRICGAPSEARKHFCRLAAPCFANWTAPDTGELDAAGQHLAHELFSVRRRMKVATPAGRAELEQRRDELQEELRGRLEENGADYGVTFPNGSSIRIRRTVSDPKVTYDIPTAIKVGAIPAATLKPFTKTGKARETWTVDGSDDVPPFTPDYGDSIPF